MTRMRWMALVGLCLVAIPASAADSWSAQLFDHLSHDFGYVPRGVTLRHTFRIVNKLRQRVHIADVRPSCPICTVAAPRTRWLEPGQSTEIVATIETHTFTGPRSVSITVTFDYPSYDETRLILKCYSRPDLVITPGQLDFGTVRVGAAVTKTVRIEYAGLESWRIDRVEVSDPNLAAQLEETHRSSGRVGYRLEVRYRAGRHVGPFRGLITLRLSDRLADTVDIPVSATVVGTAVLSQYRLFVGLAHPGETLEKSLLLRASSAVRVTEVRTGQGPFELLYDQEARRFHRLRVRFRAPDKPGIHTQVFLLHVRPEGQDTTEVIRFEATATVEAP